MQSMVYAIYEWVLRTYYKQSENVSIQMNMSQDLTEGTFWQDKSKVRYLQRKKDLAVVNNYRKFEENIFTNNKDMRI